MSEQHEAKEQLSAPGPSPDTKAACQTAPECAMRWEQMIPVDLRYDVSNAM